MTLDEYISAKQITDESFGEQIGRSRIQVFKYRHGKQMPRPEIMARIERVTRGSVTASDFYPTSKGKR